MVVARWNRLYTLGVGLLALACGGGTQPPGPPAELVITGGDAQSWYFNNPLPTPLSVTAQDVSGRAVPGVVITWAVTSGGGRVNPVQSTTDASGVATTTDSVGSSTIQTVSATFTGPFSVVSFTAHATTPPTAGSVDIANTAFNPATVVVQVNGTVTWTWSDNGIAHNVSLHCCAWIASREFTAGPDQRDFFDHLRAGGHVQIHVHQTPTTDE